MSVRVPRQWLRCTSVGIALLASACGGGGGSAGGAPAATPVVQRPTALTDLQIAELVYAGTPRTPAGFYTEPRPSSYAYVNTSHLKNTDVETIANDAAQYELCTDDWNQALAWSESAQQRSGSSADLVATDDTAHYFEFGRVRSDEPDRYLRARVFKCAYVERQSNDLRAQEGNAGVLKATPVDADALQALSEYLWQFTSYNNFGHTVLESTGETRSHSLRRTLVIANLERAGISSTCDRIYVEAWRHDASTTTGELTRTVEELWSFGARELSGGVEVCG